MSNRKRLGQHFILDSNYTDKIAASAPEITGSCVLEIGSGHGTLTRSILKLKPSKLVAIEKDRALIPALNLLQELHQNLKIINDDALEFDESKFFEEKFVIVSNLPYNISSQLLVKFLKISKKISSMTLMFQLEVANRIVAKSGNKSYGRLSVLTDAIGESKILFKVGQKVFTPPPKVESAVVRIVPQELPENFSFERLERVCKTLFQHRRKKIKSALQELFPEFLHDDFLSRLGIDPDLRAENLTTEEFCRIASITYSISR